MQNHSLKLILSNPYYSTIAFVFFGFSLIEATWIIYIPNIFDKLELSHGILGTALFFKAIGAFTAMPMSAKFISKYGEGKVTLYCLFAVLLVGIAPIVSPSFLLLCISLFVFGFFGGMLDIAMNAIVSYHEKNDDVKIMGSSHGFWSLGGMVGAGIGTYIANKLNAPVTHMVCLSVILFVLIILFAKYFKLIRGDYSKDKTKISFKSKAVLTASLIALIVMMSEGMIADWSSLYLQESLVDSITYIGLGYAGFSMAMAIGRFTSDGISVKVGSKKMISYGLIISVIGCILIITKISYLAILGFFTIGLGLSSIIPEMFRVAANFKGIEPAKGMAVIAGTGYFGFLLGPVIFGGVAELTNLHTSFIALGSLVLLALVISKFLTSENAN